MSISLDKILAAAPATTRGQPTQLSADSKGERIVYAVSRSYSPGQGPCLPLFPRLLTSK